MVHQQLSPTATMPIAEVIERIVTLNYALCHFWQNAHGWAPDEAAVLLSRSRLDWQVSLSSALKHWVAVPSAQEQAAVQILGYATLGALVEGTMKLFLAVHYREYQADPTPIVRGGQVQAPDRVALQQLRNFFVAKGIWASGSEDNWDPWIARVQKRRNAIHAFRHREIGAHDELLVDMRNYLRFVRRINSQLPYPDDMSPLRECAWNRPNLSGDFDAPQE